MDVAGKNCIQACCNNTVIGQVGSEKEVVPGMLQSLTLIFSFCIRVQISVSLGEVVYTSCWCFFLFFQNFCVCMCTSCGVKAWKVSDTVRALSCHITVICICVYVLVHSATITCLITV